MINGNLIEIWECEWDQMFRENKDIKLYLQYVQIKDSIKQLNMLISHHYIHLYKNTVNIRLVILRLLLRIFKMFETILEL